MNTELSPEINRTCSKEHGKIAKSNSFTDLAEITEHDRNKIMFSAIKHVTQSIMAKYSMAC